MSKSKVIVFCIPSLFEVLNEIKEITNIEPKLILSITEFINLNLDNKEKNILIAKPNKDLNKLSNVIFLNENPIKIANLIEKINVTLMRNKFSEQSDLIINDYSLNLNSRELTKKKIKLRLTQKEVEIILHLNKTKKSETISSLQRMVWGHNSNLETHTVETHVYRLRKKIFNSFNDENFIISTENGYKI